MFTKLLVFLLICFYKDQETIYQFEHAHGVVWPITRNIGNQSKSEQLAEALHSLTRAA